MSYEYFSPEVNIQIGSYSIQKNIILELRLDTEKSFDWVKIKFTTKLLETLNIQKDDRVTVSLGYNGSLDEVFIGNVTGVKNNEVIARDDFIKLNKTHIIHTFVKCTPQEIISFVLDKSGINSMKLSEEAYSMKDLISIRNLTALETLNYIDIKFEIKKPMYFFRGETFEWNIAHEQDITYTFEYGENILDLQNICPKVWELYTISMPKIKVLDEIEVIHNKINGTFKTDAITFYINDYGFVRTKITFLG